MTDPTILTGHDILCLSSIDWDFIWQGHQEIMSTLAARNNRVLFIENTGVRTPTLRDVPRLKQRLRNWLKGTKGFRQIRDNLFVYSPLILPFPYNRLARWLNRRLLLQALRRWMDAVGFRRPLFWTFLPTPLASELIRTLEPEIVVYYCIDDLASSSPQAKRISHSEQQLFRMADLVFVTSEKLRQRAIQFNDRVHLFPFGVNFETFEQVRHRHDGVPEDLRARSSRPIVGYIGGVHQWIDQALLVDLATAMPQIDVVLVGPLQTDTSRLAQCSNIRLLGSRPHPDVPRYIKGFQIGMIPYRLSDYTAHVYPTKLNEYLAMGIPVIATDLPEIRRFNAEHGPVVAIARNAAEFVQAIAQGLAQTSPELIQQRIEISRQNSWTMRIAKMSTLIEQQLTMRQQATTQWEVSLRRLYRVARRKAIRVALTLLTGYLLVFHSPAPWWLAKPLQVVEPARRADAIVVFAGGVGESGKARGGYQERVKQTVDLYRQGLASHVIVSSGYAFVFREAEVMKELAVALGVPASAILLETTATDTHQNVVNVERILQQHQWRTILLVSSPYHMRRALLTWRKAAPDIRVIATPVSASQFYAHGRGASLEQLRGILHEYLAILFYWLRGWI